MCGYCDEVNWALSLVAYDAKGKLKTWEKWYDREFAVYAQECLDFKQVISWHEENKRNSKADAEYVMYRVWQRMFQLEHCQACEDFLEHVDAQDLERVLGALGRFPNSRNTKILADFSIFTQSERWQALVADKQALVADASQTLEKLCDAQKLHYPPRFDEAKEAAAKAFIPKEWGDSFECFPAVYFSFLVIINYQPNSSLIKRIAMSWGVSEEGKSPSPMDDYLWMNRQAFAFCVQREGLDFFMPYFDKIRDSLIYYSFLRGGLATADLTRLKQHVEKCNLSAPKLYREELIENLDGLINKGHADYFCVE